MVVILLEIDAECSSCQVGLRGKGKAPVHIMVRFKEWWKNLPRQHGSDLWADTVYCKWDVTITSSKSEIRSGSGKNEYWVPGNQQFLIILLCTGVCGGQWGRNSRESQESRQGPSPNGTGACRMCSWPDLGMEIAALYKAWPLQEQLGPVTKCGGWICFRRES